MNQPLIDYGSSRRRKNESQLGRFPPNYRPCPYHLRSSHSLKECKLKIILLKTKSRSQIKYNEFQSYASILPVHTHGDYPGHCLAPLVSVLTPNVTIVSILRGNYQRDLRRSGDLRTTLRDFSESVRKGEETPLGAEVLVTGTSCLDSTPRDGGLPTVQERPAWSP